MNPFSFAGCDRRSFIGIGLKGLALAAMPPCLGFDASLAWAMDDPPKVDIEAVVRPPTLFAGIRKPITKREQLEPRIALLEKACGNKIAGPLTHIFRFDTPVEGYDSEIGFPVSEAVDSGDITTHTLRSMHFYSADHQGPDATIHETRRKLYQYMSFTGLSPELEAVEVFHDRDREQPERSRTQVMAAFLAWPEVYQAQLIRVLGGEAAATIWQGGEKITPHTPVDQRCDWVAASIARLKRATDVDQQYDILSRVALVRPTEDAMHYKQVFDQSGDIEEVLKAQAARLKSKTGKVFPDPCSFDGKVLHMSKVPYNQEAYDAAKTATERRKAYCFCNLVREAKDPRIDPIFCYRAAGWSRQFVELIIGRELKRCIITHSILKGDDFCAWDYHLG
jgi:hypothetical protein